VSVNLRLQFLFVRVAAGLVRAFPRLPGRWRLIAMLLPWVRHHGHHFGKQVVRLPHYRAWFECDMADWLGQYVFVTGHYDPASDRILRACVGSGDAVLDIGANVGYYSVVLARLVGPEGRVYAFEPVPALQEAVRRQRDLNSDLAVTLYPWAASDEETHVSIFIGPAGHSGLSSLRALSAPSREETVQCRPVDDLLVNLPPVSFVKLDVEGAEMKALRGMRGLLERDRPVLLLEATDRYLRAFGDTLAEMMDWLSAEGYTLYRVDETVPAGVEPLRIKNGLPEQFDVLALPGGRVEQIVAAVAVES